MAVPASLEFSLTRVGLLYRLMRRVRSVRHSGGDVPRQVLVLALVAWAPPMLLDAIDWGLTGHYPRLLTDVSIHARFLVTAPLWFIAEASLHVRSKRLVDRFLDGAFPAEGPRAVERELGKLVPLLDASAVELILASVAVIVSILIGMQVIPVPGGTRAGPESFAEAWYAFVSRPLFQFLLFRWIWRVDVWTALMWRLSRLPLRLAPAHPDRLGGLGFLAEPVVGFSLLWAGASATISGIWAHAILLGEAHLADFKQPLVLLFVASLFVTLAPLLGFTVPIVKTRFEAARQYADLALRHARALQHRWIDEARSEDIVTAPDFSAWIDLEGGYGIVRGMRAIPFGVKEVVAVAIAILAPALPLALTEVPLATLLERAAKLLSRAVLG